MLTWYLLVLKKSTNHFWKAFLNNAYKTVNMQDSVCLKQLNL